MQNSGLIILISGPSGVGKGTIIKALRSYPELKLKYSVSATTRTKRKDEIEGVNYFFKTKSEFEQLIKNNELLEYAQYVGNYYGTLMSEVNKILNQGDNLLLEIEYQGAMQVLSKYPDCVSIFILPPNLEELKRRLSERGSESEQMIEKRILQAKKELNVCTNMYKHLIINDDLNVAINDIRQYILDSMTFKNR